MKNRPIMPRTATTQTISEMSRKLTAAGLDPSRVVARAEMLAKVRGAQAKMTGEKRKRNADSMDIDEHSDDGSDPDDTMDVDGEKGRKSTLSPRKKIRGEAGAIAIRERRLPKTDRMHAGLKDSAVCI